jgi:membrane-associated protease RseP (regulator of RpoE activity)
VKDPLAEVDMTARNALTLSGVVLLMLVTTAFFFPTQIALVGVIFAFFLMIILHELGHFSMAKRGDMKVTEFFVGMGPRLWSIRKGETEYGLKAFPVGGYCKVIGMTNLDEVEPEDESRTYRAKSWSSKVLMCLAGPATHFIIAIVLMFCVVFFAADYRHLRGTGTLKAVSQGAAEAGIQPGDKVVAVAGTTITNWKQVPDLIAGPKSAPNKDGDTVQVTVIRNGEKMSFPVVLHANQDKGPARLVAGIQTETYVPHPGLLKSVSLAPGETAEAGWTSIKALGSMFSPSGISNYWHVLSGDQGKDVKQDQRFVSPVGFGKLANDAVKSGWVDVVGLLISINIFVGLLNLVPLLPFDGGHIAVATYEKIASTIRRRRVQVDITKLMPLTIAVLGVLAFIFLSSLFLDVTNPVKNPF